MKKIIFFALFLSLSSCICWTDILLTFETRDKDKTDVTEIEFIKTITGYEWRTEKDYIFATPQFSTYKYIYTDPETNTEYTAIKVGKKINITGTLNGKAENKVHNIDNKEWFQSWDMAMMYFMTTNLDVYNFWCMLPNTMEIFEFEIKRLLKETIYMNNNKIFTQKAHIGLAGFFSIFWGGLDYWVRLSDSITLQTKMDNVVTVLISEKSL